MTTYDWSCFSVRIDLKSGLEDIDAAWTTQQGLERWFLRVAEFTKPSGERRAANEKNQQGDRYRWLWHGYDDTTVEQGKILGVTNDYLVRFTFAGDCVVSVRLSLEEGVTIIHLQQENIPLDEVSRTNKHIGCLTGWTFYLANLKSVLEGGLDLRNKNEKLRKLINA